MKFGVCLGHNQHDRIEIAAKCGFDYMEVGFAGMTEATDAEFAAFRDTLNRCGIPCESANGFLPGSLPTTGDHVDFAALSAFIEKGMQRAQEIARMVGGAACESESSIRHAMTMLDEADERKRALREAYRM